MNIFLGLSLSVRHVQSKFFLYHHETPTCCDSIFCWALYWQRKESNRNCNCSIIIKILFLRILVQLMTDFRRNSGILTSDYGTEFFNKEILWIIFEKFSLICFSSLHWSQQWDGKKQFNENFSSQSPWLEIFILWQKAMKWEKLIKI